MTRILAAALLASLPTLAAAQPAPPADVAPAPAPRPVELDRRWGIGARAVSMSLSAGDDAAASEYSGGGFTASYRINRRWEIAVALDALTASESASEGPDLHSTLISARFHLRPLRAWDVYLLAGIGALHEEPLEGDDGDGVMRGQVHAGVGVGHRWRWVGVAAELHLVSAGPPEHADEMTARAIETPMAAADELAGGEFTIAASFFF